MNTSFRLETPPRSGRLHLEAEPRFWFLPLEMTVVQEHWSIFKSNNQQQSTTHLISIHQHPSTSINIHQHPSTIKHYKPHSWSIFINTDQATNHPSSYIILYPKLCLGNGTRFFSTSARKNGNAPKMGSGNPWPVQPQKPAWRKILRAFWPRGLSGGHHKSI